MTTFAAIFAPSDVRSEVDDRAWIRAMLEVERALVNAAALAGLVPADAAVEVAAGCRLELYDLDQIVAQGLEVGNPVEPLVRAMRARIGPDAADAVHVGATSQDVLDSAAMLVAARATDVALRRVDVALTACATLVERHRETPMVARTLLQQAVPTTFGLKAAGWLIGLLEARERLATVREHRLAAQLGGAAGSLGAYGSAGPELVRLFARELDLPAPTLPWHTTRGRVSELGGALAGLAGACGKIGLDVVLLAQGEVGEVAEASRRGVSSAMPQKRNPVGSIRALACARAAAGASAVLTGSLVAEHERAVGAWHAEWDALSSVLLHAGGAAAAIGDVLEGLQVFPERMRANLEASGGLPLAEQVAGVLAERIGRVEALRTTSDACSRVVPGGALRDALLDDDRVRDALAEDEIDAAFDVRRTLGAVDELVDAALARLADARGSSRE